MIAAGDGGPTLFAFGGYENGKPFVLTEVMVGTWGARAGKDGIEGSPIRPRTSRTTRSS